MPSPPTPPPDDELSELPPLDGESPDESDETPELDEEPDTDDASRDDATGEDDPVDLGDLDIADGEGGWLEGTDDADDLDMGETNLVELDTELDSLKDMEEPGVGDEDFGLGGDPEHTELDAGDEGPVAADEELREQDLPALDADEEGDVDDADLVDPGFAADEPVGLPWAAEPWVRVGAPVALSTATAVACAGRGAIVAGRLEGTTIAALLRVDLEGASEPLAAEGLEAMHVRAIAVDGTTVAVVADGGRLHVSRDGGARFEVVARGWEAADVALASGLLYVRTADGVVHVARNESPYVFAEGVVSGAAAAMVIGPSGELVSLVADAAGKPALLERAPRDADVVREAIDAAESRVPALLAARRGHVAYVAQRGGVARRDPAGTWTTHAWDGQVTAIVFVDDEGTLLAATYSETDDTTALVRLDAAGRAAVVARMGPARGDGESDGRALAMACDDAHGVVWVAGGFGVCAVATR
jgi:hypothetical protein